MLINYLKLRQLVKIDLISVHLHEFRINIIISFLLESNKRVFNRLLE